MKNKVIISPEGMKKQIKILYSMGESGIDAKGAYLFMKAIANKLKKGHYEIKFPEFHLSLRLCITGADAINKLSKKEGYSFTIITGEVDIASRLMNFEGEYIDMDGEIHNLIRVKGKKIGDNFEMCY